MAVHRIIALAATTRIKNFSRRRRLRRQHPPIEVEEATISGTILLARQTTHVCRRPLSHYRCPRLTSNNQHNSSNNIRHQ